MMDKPAENPEEDTVSLRSNGKTDGAVKETQGMLKTFRNSIRRAAEKSPLSSSGGKGSKVTAKGDESGLKPPPSPSEYRHGVTGLTGGNMAPQGQRTRKVRGNKLHRMRKYQ